MISHAAITAIANEPYIIAIRLLYIIFIAILTMNTTIANISRISAIIKGKL